MAQMVLKLSRDPATGKPVVVVELHSDADSMPYEHEDSHRALIEQLIGRGLLGPDEDPQIVITRTANIAPPGPEVSGSPETAAGKSLQAGSH